MLEVLPPFGPRRAAGGRQVEAMPDQQQRLPDQQRRLPLSPTRVRLASTPSISVRTRTGGIVTMDVPRCAVLRTFPAHRDIPLPVGGLAWPR